MHLLFKPLKDYEGKKKNWVLQFYPFWGFGGNILENPEQGLANDEMVHLEKAVSIITHSHH